ncbi:hypothetical protein BO78DRAFT_191506 [Aspergillus sclerotiicarbonarius CBS 121057]|uniref:Uncharacterized protein n=1 Tax=Aspergillus sclerotiicarbonarius (strain CBS 121057 / IBT 28362) TaxID=1448318 RepID=A0A319E2K7_ASPSB|nr:hypothetical protein BO78DRAFT_191506 [Aspergillus sclerotiicarbonarius CBS 121057]
MSQKKQTRPARCCCSYWVYLCALYITPDSGIVRHSAIDKISSISNTRCTIGSLFDPARLPQGSGLLAGDRR